MRRASVKRQKESLATIPASADKTALLAVLEKFGQYVGGEKKVFTTTFGVSCDLTRSKTEDPTAYVCSRCSNSFICRVPSLVRFCCGHFLGRKGHGVKPCDGDTTVVLEEPAETNIYIIYFIIFHFFGCSCSWLVGTLTMKLCWVWFLASHDALSRAAQTCVLAIDRRVWSADLVTVLGSGAVAELLAK